MPHVRGLHPVLAVPAVIDHQHPAAVRRGRRYRPQQLQPPRIDPLRIPPRFREEELQPLHRRVLRPGHRLGPGQRGQRLVPVPRRQQPRQVLPEPPPLRQTAEQVINRAAYPSSGPGAAGQERCRVITHPRALTRLSPAYRGPALKSTNRTASGSLLTSDYCGQLIETLSTAHGRLYAEQVTRSAFPGAGRGLRTNVHATSETDSLRKESARRHVRKYRKEISVSLLSGETVSKTLLTRARRVRQHPPGLEPPDLVGGLT